MLYDAICSKCEAVEINKPMAAAFPLRHACGGLLTRVFTPLPTHFHASGFYSSDVSRLKSQMTPARYARFEAQRADIERRARAGQLTDYERTLETIP